MAADGSVVIEITGDDSKFKKTLGALGGVASGALKGTVAAIGAVGTALTAAGGYAIKVGSDFEAGMSKVQAISGASTADMERLSAVAKEMGSTTKFSATESADALSYMAMAGWKTEQMVSGLPGIMHLAAASGEDLASVSDIVTDALTAFGLQASDSAHFADVLAKAASSSNTTVGMMGSTFQYVAPLAGAMGYSVEDTATAIGLMANAGIKGGQAGTALRSMFTRLAKPPKDAAAAIEALGLKTTDAGGRMLPLSDVIGQLRTSFSGLSEEQKIQMASSLAGQEAMSGLLAIVNASDEDFAKLSGEISNAAGAAEAMAGVMNDNLQGAMTIAKSALEGLGISLYQHLQVPAKEAVKTFSDMVAQLQTAFDRGGLEGMVRAAGDVMAQLAAKIANAAPGMVDAAVSLLQSFLAGIQNNLPALAEGAVSMVASLANGIMAMAPQLAVVAVQLTAALAVGLAQHSEGLVSAALDMVSALAQGLLDALPALIDAVPSIITGLVTGFVENLPKLVEVGVGLIAALIVGLVQAIPKIAAMVPQIIMGIVSGFTGHDWAGTGKGAVEAMAKGVKSGVPGVKGAGKSVLDAAAGSLSSLPATLQATGRGSIEKLSGGMRDSGRTAKTAAKEMADQVAGEFSGLPSKAASIGKNIADGVAEGIRKGKSNAVNAIKNMADSVMSKAKSAFKINSPSRAMRDEVGKPIPAGVGEGITDGLPRMERDVASQLAAFTKRMRAAVQGEAVGVSARLSAPGRRARAGRRPTGQLCDQRIPGAGNKRPAGPGHWAGGRSRSRKGNETEGGSIYMTPDSFSFDGCNSVDDWGLRVVCYDVLFPAKRPRKAPIPRRSGQYDYGAESWEERVVRISCTLERKCTRAEVREIAAALACKGRLRLWNEPDKYYIAELYDPAELTDHFDECMREFELRFVCEPFAYADARTEPIRAGDNALSYRGAIPAPCRITIVNPNKFPVSNITIVATGKRRQTT